MPKNQDTLRVLAISHAAVVETNQEPYDALARAGASVTVVVPRALRTDIRGRVRLRELPGSAARVIGLPVLLGGYRQALGGQRGIHLLVYAGLRRAVARVGPDVIFVEEEPFSFAAAQAARLAEKAGLPFVVHENQNIERRLTPPFGIIRRMVLSRAAGVTLRNRDAEQLVRAHGFRGPVAEFPHAVDLSRFSGGSRMAGLPRPVIGFVGRLVPEKGILDLVEAVAGIGSLLVVGDGPLRDAAQRIAHARSVPHRFLGAIPHDEVPAWYGAMDVVAVPSRTTPTWMEQFGRVVIEANAAGVPVVASDSGELPATVAATGGGVVVREGDAAALAGALRSLCADDAHRRALGEAGRAVVAARFTPQVVARALLDFLLEVAQ
ncbi:MAG: glycosyltransferase family 4 protein [Actinomycetota bacterium]